MIGQTIRHYRIMEKLGAGGMGEVYLAEDTKLKRQVALKVLPEEMAGSAERLERFQREAETLAALDHPNIVTIYSVEEDQGVRFLTMQLVEGKRLSELIPKGGMPVQRIFDIGIPLADALAAAHEQGVIHRDLKPGNIMVTDRGLVKVLDFGLAKLLPEAAPSPDTALATEPLTAEGRLVGTMPYMSPEQLEGRDLDPRSDIFSVGVLLYEMATGARPFKGETSVSLISSIVRDTPQPADILRQELPHHLGRVIGHCLEKDPEQRYQSVKDVRNELAALRKEVDSGVVEPSSAARSIVKLPDRRRPRWWITVGLAGILTLGVGGLVLWRSQPPSIPEASHPTVSDEVRPERKMIVVLPFENLGPAEDEYFADGMTEEITSRLAAVTGLGVISRTSAMQYKEDRPSLEQIGEELGVDYVLDGTVRWAKGDNGPDRVRITPQLIRVEDDSHLWADSFDRVIEDMFEIQSDIASRVVERLGVDLLLAEQQELEARPTENLAAYQAYLRGLHFSARPGSEENLHLALTHLERAVELDPGFALAFSELSKVHSFLIHFGLDPSVERKEMAKRAAERALALNPEAPLVRLDTAYYHYSADKDYSRALEELALAERGLPEKPEILFLKALIFRRQGRWEDALAPLRKAAQLNPRDPGVPMELGITYWHLRQYEEAEGGYEQAITLEPDQIYAVYTKVWMLWSQGKIGEARSALDAMPPTDEQRVLWTWVWQRMYEGDYRAAIDQLDAASRDWIRIARYAFPKSMLEGFAYSLMEELELARGSYESAREQLEAEVRRSPKDHRLHSALGITYAFLGLTDEAIQEGKRATELYPLSKDALFGLIPQEDLAFIYTTVGEHEAALELIESLLSVPSRVSTPFLELDPRWEPLREHPQFQQLLEKYRGVG
jgi:serine/threonine protein kinase/tetratricopeptide (TPR) repeat protein